MAMAGTTNACLWRGLVCSGLEKSWMRIGRFQVARCRQQHSYRREVFADRGLPKDGPKPGRRNLPPPRKANELSDDRVFNYVQAQAREPEGLIFSALRLGGSGLLSALSPENSAAIESVVKSYELDPHPLQRYLEVLKA